METRYTKWKQYPLGNKNYPTRPVPGRVIRLDLIDSLNSGALSTPNLNLMLYKQKILYGSISNEQKKHLIDQVVNNNSIRPYKLNQWLVELSESLEVEISNYASEILNRRHHTSLYFDSLSTPRPSSNFQFDFKQ